MKRTINKLLAKATGYQLTRAGRPRPAPARRGPRAANPVRKPSTGTDLTVAEGWEKYAQGRRKATGVGDVWSNPKLIGLDVDRPEDVVPYLDREVFAPFLGTSDVMLEIGPGGGRFTEILLPKCKRLIAFDTSPAMIQVLRDRFSGDADKLDLRLSNGQGLPGVEDGSVDAAFSYGVFVHLQHWDIYNYLSEINRVLRPGGRAIIQHSNTLSELGWRQFLRDTPRQLNRHKLHMSFIVNTPELMREFVTRAGLECVDTRTDVARRDCITLIQKPE